jgi:hypothetical protein
MWLWLWFVWLVWVMCGGLTILLSAALTKISSKILKRPGTKVASLLGKRREKK